MPLMIRFPDETDLEYERRTRPLVAALSATLYSSTFKKLFESERALQQRMRVNALRKSCGVTEPGTFKWDV